MMTEPVYSFTIPSLSDDILLDCRFFHPKSLLARLFAADNRARTDVKGAIIAHPYPPLGGCYDDAVVLSVTEALLGAGYIVGTFNFRGAGGSAGKSSWSGHGEVQDYSAVVGMMVYYLHHLRDQQDVHIPAQEPSSDTAATKPELGRSKTGLELVLAGYSYGSLVLARLPDVADTVKHFEAAEKGSSAAEIFLRARTLARTTIHDLQERQPRASNASRGRRLTSPDAAARSGTSPVTVGGDESDPSERHNNAARRSSDGVRELPHRIMMHAKKKHGSVSSSGSSSNGGGGGKPSGGRQESNTPPTGPAGSGPVVQVSYLLISPVLLPMTTTLAPPGVPLLGRWRRAAPAETASGFWTLGRSAMVVFGSDDVFTSGRRLRQWGEKVSNDSSGHVKWSEIEGAGHFWREHGAMRGLLETITTWAGGEGAGDDTCIE